DEKDAVLAVAARPLGQELPAALLGHLVIDGVFELAAGPEDGPLGGRGEAVRVEHGALIVVAEQHDAAAHDEIDTLAGVWAVADHVAKAIDIIDLLLLDVLEDGLKRLKVAVNVADDCLHALTLPAAA